jgi:UDP-N-acetylmuramoyl-tripeptide--D-alanyl-D-alanine ligase
MGVMRVKDVMEFCNARLVQGDPEQKITGVSIDTRTLQRGEMFVALRGARFDGHEFVREAACLGASAAVVSDPTHATSSPSALSLLQVQDTLTALQLLGANHRQRSAANIRVVAITGSSGKTTTKEMIAAVLGAKFEVAKTNGNLNNHIGVPLTLLGLNGHHQFAVVEMGMNHPGELHPLMEMARPEIGVITNVGMAHIENFHSESAIAAEKSTVVTELPATGCAILNADNKWTTLIRARTRATVVTVGIENFADFRASDIRFGDGMTFRLTVARKRDSVLCRIPVLGRHQVYNALQAAAVGWAVGMDLEEISAGLASMNPPKMRLEMKMANGVRFLNDAYNANLPSALAAMEVLAELPAEGRKMVVLGDMLELGSYSEEAHRCVGEAVAKANAAVLVTVGEQAAWAAGAAQKAGMDLHRIFHCKSSGMAADVIGSMVREGDCVLLKGSRAVHLEDILHKFGCG